MDAVIISIGDELVLGQTIDTNAAWLSAELASRGIGTLWHLTVADNRPAIADAIRRAASQTRLLIITGGLGPTDDDLTRHALADVLQTALGLDETSLAQITEFFTRRQRPMVDRNRIQAMIPAGASALPNDVGTAPGIYAQVGPAQVFIVPGVPSEMRHLFNVHIAPRLDELTGDTKRVIRTAMIHCFGEGESGIAERLGDLMARDRNPLVGTTVSDGIISARLRSEFPTTDQADRELEDTARLVHEALGPLVFGRDGQTLPGVVGELLKRNHQTLATAESCTAGLIGKMLTDAPGSSDYYLGGIIVYSNASKQRDLDIPADMLNTHGAVSEPVARLLAENVRQRFDTDYALSVTGIAGPGGATPDKPVGTVHFGLAIRDQPTQHLHRIFAGTRPFIRDLTAKTALNLLRLHLLHR